MKYDDARRDPDAWDLAVKKKFPLDVSGTTYFLEYSGIDHRGEHFLIFATPRRLFSGKNMIRVPDEVCRVDTELSRIITPYHRDIGEA